MIPTYPYIYILSDAHDPKMPHAFLLLSFLLFIMAIYHVYHLHEYVGGGGLALLFCYRELYPVSFFPYFYFERAMEWGTRVQI